MGRLFLRVARLFGEDSSLAAENSCHGRDRACIKAYLFFDSPKTLSPRNRTIVNCVSVRGSWWIKIPVLPFSEHRSIKFMADSNEALCRVDPTVCVTAVNAIEQLHRAREAEILRCPAPLRSENKTLGQPTIQYVQARHSLGQRVFR
jgi:hypothetical protein